MKITYVNNAMVVKTDLAAEKYAAAKQYAPHALKVKDEKGNDLFVVAEGSAQLKAIGAQFNAVIDGKMAITIPMTMGLAGEEAKQAIKDTYALGLAALATHEATIVANVNAALEPINAVVDSIEIE